MKKLCQMGLHCFHIVKNTNYLICKDCKKKIENPYDPKILKKVKKWEEFQLKQQRSI